MDVVVNATFSATGKKIEDLQVEDFDKVNDRNITTSFFLTHRCGAEMKQGWAVINFASMYRINCTQSD
jgi:NAD(P)-dependent dehydrogenase (short-subunit alcohol dehydrogenase family)